MAKFENLWRDRTPLWALGHHSAPIHFPYLRDQVLYKFHRSRTTNIKVIEWNAFLFFWKPTKGYNSKSYRPLAPIPVNTIQPVIVYVYTNFQLPSFHSSWQIWYENFQEWQNLKTYEGTELRVMGPWPPFCHYTFLTLKTKCGIRFIEVGPQI